MTQKNKKDLAEITTKAAKLDTDARQRVLAFISGLSAGIEMATKGEQDEHKRLCEAPGH